MLFSSLPAEIRIMIYRNLRTTSRPELPLSQSPEAVRGYCSYGFYWKILATTRTISEEAKEVFYAENDWTFRAAPHVAFDSQIFHHSPVANSLSWIRNVHINFELFRYSFVCLLTPKAKDGAPPFQDFQEICKVLTAAPSLKVVSLVWVEFAAWNPYLDPVIHSHPAQQRLQAKIHQGLQPLANLQPSCLLQKGQVSVQFRSGLEATAMETAFHNAVDEVITHHQSKHVQQKQIDRPREFR